MARVKVSPEYNLPAIAEAAGQPDDDKRRYEDGQLVVEGVTQEALEEALAGYDHTALRRERKEAEAIERFSDLLRQRTGSDTNDFAMSMSIVAFYKAYKVGETPEELEELENLGDLAEQKIYEVRTAEDPDSVELP